MMKTLDAHCPLLRELRLKGNEIGPVAAGMVVRVCHILEH